MILFGKLKVELVRSEEHERTIPVEIKASTPLVEDGEEMEGEFVPGSQIEEEFDPNQESVEEREWFEEQQRLTKKSWYGRKSGTI